MNCKQCNTKLKIKYHFRGCGYNNIHGTLKEIDFWYCPECGNVYYFDKKEKDK